MRGCGGHAHRTGAPGNPMTETVSCEIVLGDGRPWRGHLAVLRLSWVDSDPLAVVVVVGARPPHPALLRGRWVVLRDALRAVLAPDGGSQMPARPAGHVPMSRQGEHVTLTLRSPSLPCVVTVPAGPDRKSTRLNSIHPSIPYAVRPATPRSPPTRRSSDLRTRPCCAAAGWFSATRCARCWRRTAAPRCLPGRPATCRCPARASTSRSPCGRRRCRVW